MQTYPPGTRIGQYEIASRPMMGGMGVVYFALNHGNDGRPVALKTFRPELLPNREARDRFLREGTAWVELGNHLHIVRCYKVEYIDPTAFLVLELIAKEQNMPDASLRSWLIPGRPLPLEQALLFALQIARGMQYATEKIPGFVHRDLKPENILVGADKLPGTNINRLRVTDFGLAKTVVDNSVQATMGVAEEVIKLSQIQFTRGVGTPLYMAPEQWKGEPIGIFTDIYAFGCILHELLNGQHAVNGKTIGELRLAHCDGKLNPTSSDLPEDLSLILANCLVINPNQRYKNWEELINSIESYFQQSRMTRLQTTKTSDLNHKDLINTYWSYSAIGQSYAQMGKQVDALGFFEKMLSLAHKIGDQRGEGAALGNLGITYRNLGDAKKAIWYHEQALIIDREIHDQFGESHNLGGLGNAYASLGDAQRAIEYYENQMLILRELDNRYEMCTTLGNLGNVYHNLGDLNLAVNFHKQSLKITQEIGDRRGEGRALNNLGNAYLDMGNFQQAIWCAEQTLMIAREIGDLHGEGTALGNLGTYYNAFGEVQRAIQYFEKHLAITREIGDRHGEGNALGNLGVAYKNLSDLERAVNCYEQQLMIVREIGDRYGEGGVYGNLGIAYQLLGDMHNAVGYYEKQLNIVREINDRRGEGIVLGNLGVAYKALGEIQQSLEFHQQALIIRREIGATNLIASSCFNMALIYLQRGQAAHALPLAQEAAQIWKKTGSPNALNAQQLISELQNTYGLVEITPVQSAFEYFQYANSSQDMKSAITKYPFMTENEFIHALEEFVVKEVPSDLKSVFEQRLTWLRQIAAQK